MTWFRETAPRPRRRVRLLVGAIVGVVAVGWALSYLPDVRRYLRMKAM